jgi:hypothetical protein
MLGLTQRHRLLISSLVRHAAGHRSRSEVVSNLGGPTHHRTTYAEVERRSRRARWPSLASALAIAARREVERTRTTSGPSSTKTRRAPLYLRNNRTAERRALKSSRHYASLIVTYNSPTPAGAFRPTAEAGRSPLLRRHEDVEAEGREHHRATAAPITSTARRTSSNRAESESARSRSKTSPSRIPLSPRQ